MSDESVQLTQDVTGMPLPDGVEVAEGDGGPPGGAWKTDVLAQMGSALALVGQGMEALVTAEQQLSKCFAGIAWGPFAAMRMGDITLGMPHPHLPLGPVPPFGPVVRFLPLPQPGFVLPMGFLSGSPTITINGTPAARLGDMGLCIPLCLGLMPLFEIFFGSATVWFDGQRAARQLDPTLHCNLLDQPTGLLKLGLCMGPGAGDVLVGGVPLPSATDFAAGKLMDGLMGGLSRAARAVARRLKKLDGLTTRLRRLNRWRARGDIRPWKRPDHRPTILVTYFAPFSSFRRLHSSLDFNASQRVAEAVQEQWMTNASRFGFPRDVRLEFIPVPIDANWRAVEEFVIDLRKNLPPGNAVVSLGEVGSPWANVRIEDLHNWAPRPIGGHQCQNIHQLLGNAPYDWHAEFIHVPGMSGLMGDFGGTVDEVIDILSRLANGGGTP